MITARNLRHGDVIPDALSIGFNAADLTHELVWVVEDDGNICGVAIAFAAHQFLYPIRIAMVSRASTTCLLRLVRKMFVDSYRRGILYYLMILGDDDVTLKLARTMKSHGASSWIGSGGIWCGGSIYDLMKRQIGLVKSNAA